MKRLLCPICCKPLGLGRVRQHIRIHPHCRRSLTRDQVEQVLEQAGRVLGRIPADADDEELKSTCRAARETAERLVDDLQALRGYLAGR